MLPRVEVRVFVLLFFFHDVLEQHLLLFLGQRASVNADGLLGEFLHFGLVLLLDCRSLLLPLLLPPRDRRRFFVVLGRLEVEVDIGLHTADLVIRLAIDHVNQIVAARKLNADRVSLVQHRVVSQFILQTKESQAKLGLT